jgi:RecA/RadA recombinase
MKSKTALDVCKSRNLHLSRNFFSDTLTEGRVIEICGLPGIGKTQIGYLFMI